MTDVAPHIHCPFCSSTDPVPYQTKTLKVRLYWDISESGCREYYFNAHNCYNVKKYQREMDNWSGLSEFMLKESAEQKGEWNCQSMPVSNYLQISPIMDKIVNLHPSTILDVGCGLGIYGALSRVFLESDNLYDRTDPPWNKKENWNVKIDSIEGFAKYITDLNNHVYNHFL